MRTILIMLLALSACTYTGNVADQAREEQVKIGVLVPLTGFLADMGADARKGIQLAMEEHPNVRVVFEDEACDSTTTVNAYHKLKNIDQVDYIVGPLCGQSSQSILPLVNADEIVTIAYGSPDNELAQPKDYYFRTQIKNSYETKAMAEWLKENSYERVAVFTALNSFGQSYKQSFIDSFKGDVIAAEGSEDYQTDYRTEIAKLLEANPDAIFLVTASRKQMGCS